MIAGHNLLDGIRAEQFGAYGWVWNFAHEPGMLHFGDVRGVRGSIRLSRGSA